MHCEAAALDRHARRMVGGQARPARGREGLDTAQRRARAATATTAVGYGRQAVSIRDRRGHRIARRSLSGRSQLLVYHFMFGPDYKAGCPSCSAIADGFNGFVVHLANHDVTLCAVSRAPLAKLQAYKRRMGWTFPWASSFDSDFNSDFSVAFTEEQQREERRVQLPARAASRCPRSAGPRPRRSIRRRDVGTDAAPSRASGRA